MRFKEKQVDGLTSIVILSYNRPENLRRNIESLYATANGPFEVILFDNASPDKETHELLTELEGRTREDGNGLVKIIRNDENVGCSAGRQQALTYTRGEFIITMDDDMTYKAGWLDALHKRLEQDPKIAAAMCKTVFPNGIVQVNGGGYIEQEHGRLVNFIPLDPYKSEDDPMLTGEQDCDWIGGGATIIRRSVAEQVEHKSKEIYLNGYEDYDYSLEIRKLGYRIVNCPSATVYHHHFGHDLKEVAELERKNPDYVKARKNRDTVMQSLMRFAEQTGLILIREFKGNNMYRANGESLEGKTPEEIEQLSLQELTKRNLIPAPYPDNLVTESAEFHRNQRAKIRAQYQLNDSELSMTNIRTILGTYKNALTKNTSSIDMDKLAEIIHKSFSEWIELLETNSPNAGYFFNIEDGTLTTDAVYNLTERITKTWTPIDNNPDYDWAPKYILGFVINSELKYAVTEDLPESKKAKLKESRDTYSNAARELRRGHLIEALNLYDRVLELSPSYKYAVQEHAVALERLSEQLERELSTLKKPESLRTYNRVSGARDNLTGILDSKYNELDNTKRAQETAQELLAQGQYDLAEEVAIGITAAQKENTAMWKLIGDAVSRSHTAARPDRVQWAQQCYQRSLGV